MRALAVVLLLAGLTALAPRWALAGGETPSPLAESDRVAIRAVIEQQIQAFRADDGPGAFALASPAIQTQFGTPETFLDMVRRGYVPVYRPSSMAFGPLVEIEGRTVQKVELVGPDRQEQLALYFMEHEADGSWRISGCILTDSASIGA